MPLMPTIYSNAWNVIAWLGDEGHDKIDTDSAITFIPKVLNLKILDRILQDDVADVDLLLSCISFGELLHNAWFRRRWVIQEVACARRLSVRIGSDVISWVDFADAIELYTDKIDLLRDAYSRSWLSQSRPNALRTIDCTRAMSLIEMSRSVLRKSLDSKMSLRLMSLEFLVLKASTFAVSDIRDIVYALLHLANDGQGHDIIPSIPSSGALTADYSKHPVDIFRDFVRGCIRRSRSLDIICWPWAAWPRLDHSTKY